jgi:hypothetical protein
MLSLKIKTAGSTPAVSLGSGDSASPRVHHLIEEYKFDFNSYYHERLSLIANESLSVRLMEQREVAVLLPRSAAPSKPTYSPAQVSREFVDRSETRSTGPCEIRTGSPRDRKANLGASR